MNFPGFSLIDQNHFKAHRNIPGFYFLQATFRADRESKRSLLYISFKQKYGEMFEVVCMKYVALLRGINVGGNRKVEMKKLKALFESMGFTNVSTYINSGNVMFESRENKKQVLKNVEAGLRKAFAFEIPTLVKTEKEIQKIADAIPSSWKNDSTQRTDVAYLFSEIDSKDVIDELPVEKAFMDIRYVKGAIFWNVKRKDVYKSRLAKLISHKLYKSMTVRNINTARYLAEGKK